MDIVLQYTSARIERMSRRRQKIALSKRPSTRLTNCYPIATDGWTCEELPAVSMINVNVNFTAKGCLIDEDIG